MGAFMITDILAYFIFLQFAAYKWSDSDSIAVAHAQKDLCNAVVIEDFFHTLAIVFTTKVFGSDYLPTIKPNDRQLISLRFIPDHPFLQ
jgi:hypothetical protein